MDFDLDDPLGDLLSDGSNDSFFGATKKKPEAKKSAIQVSSDVKSKSKVADLFGIDNDLTANPIENKSKPSIDLNVEPKPNQTTLPSSELWKSPIKEDSIGQSTIQSRQSMKPSTPIKSQSSNIVPSEIPSKSSVEPVRSMKKETRFDDSDDFLNELGFDPKHPKGGIAKKSNILDDILKFNRTEQPKSTPITSNSKPTATANESEKKVMKSAEINTNPNRYSPSLGRPRNAARSGSAGSADPLGFFSTPTKQSQETKTETAAASAKSKPSKKAAVDWLGIDADSEVKPVELSTEAKPATESKPQSAIVATMPTEKISAAIPINVETVIPTSSGLSSNLNIISMASFEKEQALQSLQQQETQLRIATQMKHQENLLHDMQSKQQTLIKQQEHQFDELIKRQINRQNQLESQIQVQQQQINAYINVLMNQPNFGLMAATNVLTDTNEVRPEEETISRQHFIELEADVKRLELEKMRLEDILQSVQSSHEQELELLHTSHKKQIALLEENLDSLERRLREEIESTKTYHLNKISAVQMDIDNQRQKYDDQIDKLVTDYEKQIDKLRVNYEHELESLKNDQRSTIENIRQAKLLEFATIQDSGSYLHTLKSASDHLEHASDNLQSMRTNIDSTIERMQSEREVQLNAKEHRLNEQQKSIEKCVEKTEEERTRLIELVKSLEIQFNLIQFIHSF